MNNIKTKVLKVECEAICVLENTGAFLDWVLPGLIQVEFVGWTMKAVFAILKTRLCSIVQRSFSSKREQLS